MNRVRVSPTGLVCLVAAYLALTGNLRLFRGVVEAFPPGEDNLGFVLSTGLVLTSVFALLLLPFNQRLLRKPVLVVTLMVTAVLAAFMDTYGVAIDADMVRNVFETDREEAAGLLSTPLVLRVLLLGALPAWLVLRIHHAPVSLRRHLTASAVLALCASLTIIASWLSYGSHYASLVRQHRPLRYYTNPTYPLYAMVKYLRQRQAGHAAHTDLPRTIAQDAQIPTGDTEHELVIVIVSETVRADHFSLNGYERRTNPRLETIDNLVSFDDVASCATATARSVPCMFAQEDRTSFDPDRSKNTENALDILARTGVEVLWRDNNSGSKGVADRVAYEDFSTPKRNPLCNPECRDEGMLQDLQDFIDVQTGDAIIVLHQMGSHGPEYDRRYPDPFRVFTPVCARADLSACEPETIRNAYDNTILYTDHFIAEAIALLQRNTQRFETALLYVSDHGESLGEHGIYLHGLPYAFAPEAQTHVAAMIWVEDAFDVAPASIRENQDRPLTHASVFHTLLDLFEIESASLNPGLSLLRRAAGRSARAQ